MSLPPSGELDGGPDPGEYFLFFRYLAGLDAAAAKEEAAGYAAASEWRSLEQRTAGLTDVEGAILKQVAYGCNQALRDRDAAAQTAAATPGSEPPAAPLEIVGAAVDDLRSQLGDEAFALLDARVHSFYEQPLDTTGGGSEPPLPVSSAPTGGGGDLGPPVPADSQYALEIIAKVGKLDSTHVNVYCDTGPENGQITGSYYVNTITNCVVGDGAATTAIPCDEVALGFCFGAAPASAGHTYTAHGVHGLIMYSVQCGDGPGLDDPLHYGNPPGYPLRSVVDFDRLYPLGDPEPAGTERRLVAEHPGERSHRCLHLQGQQRRQLYGAQE